MEPIIERWIGFDCGVGKTLLFNLPMKHTKSLLPVVLLKTE